MAVYVKSVLFHGYTQPITQRTSCSGYESETRLSAQCTTRHGRSTTPPCCSTTSRRACVSCAVAETIQRRPSCWPVSGDFNQLTDSAVIEQTGLVQLVQQPTRGASIVDRLFVSSPAAYTTLRVVASTVRSDHRAIVAYSAPPPNCTAKTITTKSYRRISRRRNTLCFCSTFPPQTTHQLIRLTVLSLL